MASLGIMTLVIAVTNKYKKKDTPRNYREDITKRWFYSESMHSAIHNSHPRYPLNAKTKHSIGVKLGDLPLLAWMRHNTWTPSPCVVNKKNCLVKLTWRNRNLRISRLVIVSVAWSEILLSLVIKADLECTCTAHCRIRQLWRPYPSRRRQWQKRTHYCRLCWGIDEQSPVASSAVIPTNKVFTTWLKGLGIMDSL